LGANSSNGPPVPPERTGEGLRALLHDTVAGRRERVAGLISAASADACSVVTARDAGVAGGHSFAVALVALGGDAVGGLEQVDRESLDVLGRMRQEGVPIISYAGGSTSWSLPTRCQALLAGAATLLDSTVATFEGDLSAALRRRLLAAEGGLAGYRRAATAARHLGIVGDSPAMRSVLLAVERSARLTDMPALLLGESGTGKELFARAIHTLDDHRRTNPFVSVNCAALTKTLAESELFGHRRGAYSGADRERQGLVRAADGGVLFLDEIGELDLELQAKLLRVIQERTVLVLGDAHETRVDIRVVGATHRDLQNMVRDGRFRADLFQRLWVYPIDIPPLRQRREDIPTLVRHFLEKYWGRDRAKAEVTPEFVAALGMVRLEGNVRQLENVVQRAVAVVEDHHPIGLAELPRDLWIELGAAQVEAQAAGPRTLPPSTAAELKLDVAILRHEKLLIETALRTTQGNQSRAARLLGITSRTLYDKLRKHKLVARTGASAAEGD
jgi:transcriptional regulator with PAS, ATPase and Fis domain